jgi:hypothetical protein
MREKGPRAFRCFSSITHHDLHHLQQRIRHFGRRWRHTDARRAKGSDLGCCSPFAATDDCAGVTHPAARRRRCSRDKPGHRLFAILLDPFAGFFLRRTANLANHDNPFSFRIRIKHLYHIQVGGSVHRVASDAYACGLANPPTGQLPDRFIGERAASGNNSNISLFVNVSRRDTDSAAAVRILALTRCDDSGAIGADQARLFALHRPFNLYHVIDRNAFGDANHQIKAGVRAFKNRIRSERRRHEDGRSGCTRLFHGFGHCIENWNFVFESLAAFARRDTGDDLSAVAETELSVPGAERTGDALNKNASLRSDENRHRN